MSSLKYHQFGSILHIRILQKIFHNLISFLSNANFLIIMVIDGEELSRSFKFLVDAKQKIQILVLRTEKKKPNIEKAKSRHQHRHAKSQIEIPRTHTHLRSP